jgi:hypothetical protein
VTERLRRLYAGVAAVAVVGAVLAAVAWGSPQNATSGQYQYENKVTICHQTGSETNPSVTITVSRNALPAHFAHGDTIGPC